MAEEQSEQPKQPAPGNEFVVLDTPIDTLCEQLDIKMQALCEAAKALRAAGLYARRTWFTSVVTTTSEGTEVMQDLESLIYVPGGEGLPQKKLDAYFARVALQLMEIMVMDPESEMADPDKWYKTATRTKGPFAMDITLPATPIQGADSSDLIGLRRRTFLRNRDVPVKLKRIKEFVRKFRHEIAQKYEEQERKIKFPLGYTLRASESWTIDTNGKKELQRLCEKITSRLENADIELKFRQTVGEALDSDVLRDAEDKCNRIVLRTLTPLKGMQAVNKAYMESVASALLQLRRTLMQLEETLSEIKPVMEEKVDLPTLVTPKMLTLLGVGDQER